MHVVLGLLLALSAYSRRFPVPVARFPRTIIGMNQQRYEWRSVDSELASSVARRYFDTEIPAAENKIFEVYLIEGVPAAAMLCSGSSKKVDAFHLNLDLLILFDAADDMRAKFYARYGNFSVEYAQNAHIFLSCV